MSAVQETSIVKFNSKEAVIGITGLGYVGLPLMLRYNSIRFKVLAIAYKKNVDAMRESPSVEVMELIRDKGAEVAYSDLQVPKFPKMRAHKFDLNSAEITAETLACFDAVVLTTNHDAFDYDLIKQHSKLIVDTRDVYREPAAHIIRA